jgi:hypothetical protein
MGDVMPTKATMLVALAVAVTAMPALAQPAGGGADPPSPKPAVPLPGMQHFQIRQDTFAQRETFLRQRALQMQQQKIEPVAPLPAQRIEAPPPPQK